MVPDDRCYLRFRKLRHPADMGVAEIHAVPWYLPNEKGCAFKRKEITIRQGKRGQDRLTMRPLDRRA